VSGVKASRAKLRRMHASASAISLQTLSLRASGRIRPLRALARKANVRPTVACGSSAFRSLATACHTAHPTQLTCAQIVAAHGRASANGSITRQDSWPSPDQGSIVASAILFVLQGKARIVSVERLQTKSKKVGATMVQECRPSVPTPWTMAAAALRNAAGMDGLSRHRSAEVRLQAAKPGA